MKQLWWKILTCVILIYVFVAGVIVPLSPSIYSIDKSTANSGAVLKLSVTGYNTFFTKDSGKLRAYLQRDSTFAICAGQVAVIDDTHMDVLFDIPPRIAFTDSTYSFSFIIDGPYNGFSVLPDAVLVKQLPSRAMEAQPCLPASLHNGAFAFTFPFRNILEETIRNLYYHVPLWFAMILLFLVSMINSIRYLNGFDLKYNLMATEYVRVGVVFGILGLITGAIWAKHTWGEYWNWDLRQVTAAIAILIYLAYFVLRDSFDEEEKKARLAAVYNIFAFAALFR